MSTRFTVAVCGHGRSGKDTVAKFLRADFGLRYAGSTSWFAKEYVADRLGISAQEAWDSRHQHRRVWKDLCNELRRHDPLFFVNQVLACADIVTGLREEYEVKAAVSAGLLTHVLWVSRPGVEPDPTMAYGPELATSAIENGGTEDDLRGVVRRWAEGVGLTPLPS